MTRESVHFMHDFPLKVLGGELPWELRRPYTEDVISNKKIKRKWGSELGLGIEK